MSILIEAEELEDFGGWTLDSQFETQMGSPYSADIDNLMMAGKHISVTHIAGSVTKFMGNGAHHAIATASAAFLCKKHGVTPRSARRPPRGAEGARDSIHGRLIV